VPNLPYSVKSITPATPISLMMELKNWQNESIKRVKIISEDSISEGTYSLLAECPERDAIAHRIR